MSLVNRKSIDLLEASISKQSTPDSRSPWQQAAGLRRGGARRTVPKGETIFKNGENAEFLYRVASGVVRTYTILNDGRRIIDDFHFPDDIVGLHPGTRHRFSADAVCDTVVTTIRRSDLDGLLDCDKELGKQVHSSLVVSLERTQDHLLLLGCRSARERILAFLGSMARRISRSGAPDFKMQQSDIADYLGLTRETVSRTLSQLACVRLPSSRSRYRAHWRTLTER